MSCRHFCLGITSLSKHVANINQMAPEYHVIFYLRYGCDIKYIHQFVLFSKLYYYAVLKLFFLDLITCKCVRLDSFVRF